VNLKTCKVFVLDEADAMFAAGGHRANTRLIKKSLPKTCQSLLFSATFDPFVLEFASKLVPNAVQLLVDGDDKDSNNGAVASTASTKRRETYLVVDAIKQLWIDTRGYEGGKIMFLADIYNLMTIGQSIVFVETRDEAESVHSALTQGGYSCGLLHGGLDAGDRDASMRDFRTGRSNVLIATNVLARGVDIDAVCLVVCLNVPTTHAHGVPDYETYLHRIGRTGRFGRKGTAITLVSDDADIAALRQIDDHYSSNDGDRHHLLDGETMTSGTGRMIQRVDADPEALADIIEI